MRLDEYLKKKSFDLWLIHRFLPHFYDKKDFKFVFVSFII